MTSSAASVSTTNNKWPEDFVRIVSFDGGISLVARVQRPDRYRYFSGSPVEGEHRIPRGSGLSYVAASFGGDMTSVDHKSFNRILGFDSGSGLVRVEPGITLGELYRFLAAKGMYMPVQPGHGSITVGGCIAADVHGKNHQRDGSFVNHVVGLTLFHPDHGNLRLSRKEEPKLFDLTCGGYGLTGHILSADLRFAPMPGASARLKIERSENVYTGIGRLREVARHSDFAYSWHDFTRKGERFGAGFTVTASFLEKDFDLSEARPHVVRGLSSHDRGQLPLGLLNRCTAGLLNRAYSLRSTLAGTSRTVDIFAALFPAQEAQVYFKLFGRRGFHEYQVLVPWEHSTRYLREIQDYLHSRPMAITLASAKCFGGRRKLLRFSGDGLCFALNIPRDSRAPAFLDFLDGLLPKLNGVPNLIKDSRLPRVVVDSCYAGADEFRLLLRDFDPRRRFRSELSERLGL